MVVIGSANLLTLQIQAGEKVAVIGRSGVGQTTLLRTLRQQQSLEGCLVSAVSGLVPPLSVFHNVFMGAQVDILRHLIC